MNVVNIMNKTKKKKENVKYYNDSSKLIYLTNIKTVLRY